MKITDYLKDLEIPEGFHEMLTKEFLTDFFNEVINAFKFLDLKEGKEPQPYETYTYMDWWIHINLCGIYSDSFCAVCNKYGFSDMAEFYSKVGYPYSDPLDEYICDCMMEYGLIQLENEVLSAEEEISDTDEYTPSVEIDAKLDYHFISVLYSKCTNCRMQNGKGNTAEQSFAFFDSKKDYINALYETCKEFNCMEVIEFYKTLETDIQRKFDLYMEDLLNDYELIKIEDYLN